MPGGVVQHKQPVVYQETTGRRQAVAGRLSAVGARRIGFALGRYDHSKPLVIDPVLVYSSYLGGPQNEDTSDIVVDVNGDTYITGATRSAAFPTSNPVQAALSGVSDAFVTKLHFADHLNLVYSTFLGGSGSENGPDANGDAYGGIAVDAGGNAYVTGFTTSTDFPLKVGPGGGGPIQGQNHTGRSRATRSSPSWTPPVSLHPGHVTTPTWAGTASTPPTASPWTARATPSSSA